MVCGIEQCAHALEEQCGYNPWSDGSNRKGEHGEANAYAGVPYRIGPVRNPAKLAFSENYSGYGIFGALESSDQVFSKEANTGRTCLTGERNFSGGFRMGEGKAFRTLWEEANRTGG